MPELTKFPDIEDLLTTLFEDLGATGTETPSVWAGNLPFIRVRRFGGQDDGITDYPLVDIDSFTANRASAITLAEDIRQRLIGGYHVVGTSVIDRVETTTGPRELPWAAEERVRRWSGTYRIHTRR